jgi:hypothetical protein
MAVETSPRRKWDKTYVERKRAEKQALLLATGKEFPSPVSVVNKVTEYGALFNKLNKEALSEGKPALKTAMEILIEAMQSDKLDIKEKAKIAEKLATFESSRAPIISIEHVQNVMNQEEQTADEALEDFLATLRKT